MDTSKVARIPQWHARIVKGGLRDGMCANTELELDHVADRSLELPWGEGELVLRRGGDFDDMDFDVGGGGGGCEDRSSEVG